MMTIFDVPKIEGGTDKQRMFADSVRIQFIVFCEENFDQDLQKEAELVLVTRLDYRWWIDRVNKIDFNGVKGMIRGTKAAITHAGSIDAAVEVQRLANKKRHENWLNSRPLGGILDGIRKEA